eukprot:7633286-Alexandrium_andersonii.AAC.1
MASVIPAVVLRRPGPRASSHSTCRGGRKRTSTGTRTRTRRRTQSHTFFKLERTYAAASPRGRG